MRSVFFRHQRRGGPNQTGFNINGQSAPPVVQEHIPAEGTVTKILTAGSTQFIGAAVLDILTRACFNRVDMLTKYFIKTQDQLAEVFSYTTPKSIGLNKCVRLPVNFVPQPDVNGQTRVPGIAKVSVNPLKDSEYCVQLMDDQGNSLTDPECQTFDGSHDASLLTQYFPTQGAFNGSAEVCFNGEPSSSFRDQISVLPIEVIQEDGIIQLGTNKATLTNPGRCVQDGNTLCLNGDRFKVEVDSGMVADINPDDSGLFYFFDPDNWELLVKVLDGCGGNNNYWVFFAATTDVEFTVTVTDTQTSQTRTYQNPGAFAALTDTSAFATCP